MEFYNLLCSHISTIFTVHNGTIIARISITGTRQRKEGPMAETVDMLLFGDPKLWLGARPCIMPIGVGETIFRTDCLHPSCLTCGFRHHISLSS